MAAPTAKRSCARDGRSASALSSATACGLGMRSSSAERRAQQLEQGRERDLRLGLDAPRPQQLHPGGVPGGVIEQRGLADPRLADQRQHRAVARPRALQGCSHLAPLTLATNQHAADSGTRDAPGKTRCPPEANSALRAIRCSRQPTRRVLMDTTTEVIEVDGDKLMQFVFRRGRRGRRDAERGAGRDGRQARALPRARRSRRAVARGARRAHRRRASGTCASG